MVDQPEIVFKLRALGPAVAPGETWTATLQGIDLSDLTLTMTR